MAHDYSKSYFDAMTHQITQDHFRRAALEIGSSGENDALPYEVDAQFVKERADQLASVCFGIFEHIQSMSKRSAAAYLNGITVGSERLLAATGSHGFRITTRIHPFWNLYLNGLGLGIAEANEGRRSTRVHSYRLSQDPQKFFDRDRSWRAYKEATLAAPLILENTTVIIQTDISSFYDRIYHHRLENAIDDIFGDSSSVATQVDRLLSQIAAGRSFGLPVGGQCARVLAEVMMSPLDALLSDEGIEWHRYVDDYTLICSSQQEAYRSLSALSHVLADVGLSLNRTKTTIMGANHYKDYISALLGNADDSSLALRELDLHFDPYSDNASTEYATLKESIKDIDISFLLDMEKEKSQPDAFIVAQISRSLKLQDAKTAAQLCATLLDPRNLDAFRASWSKILRGVYAVRAGEEFEPIHERIDELLDAIPDRASHLLTPEANVLHYLRALRFRKTEPRGRAVNKIYDENSSQAVRRACIDCWRHWGDRGSFRRLRNNWQNLGSDEQRMVWLAAASFGEEGLYARKQLDKTIEGAWRLGIEDVKVSSSFASIYKDWANHAA